MISIERCKKILNQNGKKQITDDEVKLIRSLLTDWARIQIEIEDLKNIYMNTIRKDQQVIK